MKPFSAAGLELVRLGAAATGAGAAPGSRFLCDVRQLAYGKNGQIILASETWGLMVLKSEAALANLIAHMEQQQNSAVVEWEAQSRGKLARSEAARRVLGSDSRRRRRRGDNI